MLNILRNKIVGSFGRHSLTVIGGILIEQGTFSPNEWQTISGAVIILVGLGLSTIEKKFFRG